MPLGRHSVHLLNEIDDLTIAYVPVKSKILDNKNDFIGKGAFDKKLREYYNHLEFYCYTDKNLADERKESTTDCVACFINGKLSEFLLSIERF